MPEARFNKSLRPRKPEGSLGRTAQDVHLDSHTAPELCYRGSDPWTCIPYHRDPVDVKQHGQGRVQTRDLPITTSPARNRSVTEPAIPDPDTTVTVNRALKNQLHVHRRNNRQMINSAHSN